MTRASKKRKTRDPARPKRAMTPFLYYACEQREILKQGDEKLTLPQQSKLIAEKWKNVQDKSKYIALAATDKQRYVDEMKHYNPPKKVKRPRSSYAFFMKDMRYKIANQFPDKNPRELMGDIAAAWRHSSEDEKSIYVRMAEEDKIRYTQEKEQEKNTTESI